MLCGLAIDTHFADMIRIFLGVFEYILLDSQAAKDSFYCFVAQVSQFPMPPSH